MVLKLVTLGKVNQKYLESHGMWCYRRMGKISWTDLVRNEKVLQKSRKRHILDTIKRRNAKWIGHFLRKNCLLKHITEGTKEVTGRRGRRHKQLLNRPF